MSVLWNDCFFKNFVAFGKVRLSKQVIISSKMTMPESIFG